MLPNIFRVKVGESGINQEYFEVLPRVGVHAIDDDDDEILTKFLNVHL